MSSYDLPAIERNPSLREPGVRTSRQEKSTKSSRARGQANYLTLLIERSLLHSDLARLDGFGFWQRYGEDPLVDICGNLSRIDRWSELVDATEIVRTDLGIYQFTGNFDRLPTTQND